MRDDTGWFIRFLTAAAAVSMLATACGDDGGDAEDAAAVVDDAADADVDGTADPGGDEPADDEPDGDAPTGDRSAELTGSWTITTYQLAGAAGEATPAGDTPATITLGSDGTFTYSTGCNTGEGTWRAFGVYGDTGQLIEFGDLSKTEIGCPEELADQDLAIGGAIRAADLFTLDAGILMLMRDGNLMIEAEAS